MKTCLAISSVINPKAPIALSGNIEERIFEAKSIGFDAVEIHTPSAATINVDRIGEICADAKIEVATLGTGTIWGKFGFSLTDHDAERRSVLNSMLFEFIDVASKLGSKITIGSVKGNIIDNSDYQILKSEMRLLSEYAEKKKVVILLEATNRYENNYFNRGEEIQEFIVSNQLNNVEILMDTFHINIEEEKPQEAILKVERYLGHVHFADNNRLYPGGGCFDFSSIIRGLEAIKYNKYLSVECLPIPNGSIAAKKAYEFLKNSFHL